MVRRDCVRGVARPRAWCSAVACAVLRGCVRGAVRPRAQRGAAACVVRCGCVRGVALLCEWCGVAVNVAWRRCGCVCVVRRCCARARGVALLLCVWNGAWPLFPPLNWRLWGGAMHIVRAKNSFS